MRSQAGARERDEFAQDTATTQAEERIPPTPVSMIWANLMWRGLSSLWSILMQIRQARRNCLKTPPPRNS